MISTIFQRFVISTFPIYTYFNVILTPGFTDEMARVAVALPPPLLPWASPNRRRRHNPTARGGGATAAVGGGSATPLAPLTGT